MSEYLTEVIMAPANVPCQDMSAQGMVDKLKNHFTCRLPGVPFKSMCQMLMIVIVAY